MRKHPFMRDEISDTSGCAARRSGTRCGYDLDEWHSYDWRSDRPSDQTQNGISDERLAERCKCGLERRDHTALPVRHLDDQQRLVTCFQFDNRKSKEQIEVELTALRKALSDPTTVHVNILRGTIALTKGQAIHIAGLPADIEEQLTTLRASHKRLVEVAGSVPFRFAWCSDSDEHGPFCRCGRRELTDALAEARKLEGK